MAKVSIIIPSFNSAEHLPKALNSIITQGYQDFEIIIVDDGSIDATPEIVDTYNKLSQNKIRYFYQNNQGPGAARNRGITEARGEYIAFLDADDLLVENSLMKRVNFLGRYPDIALVFTDYYLKDGSVDTARVRLRECKFLDTFRGVMYPHEDNNIIFNYSFFSKYLEFSPHPIWTGTVMLRKDITKAIGLFRTDISIAEDADYWLRIIQKYNAGYINEPLSVYHHDLSKLTKNSERYNLHTLRVYRDFYAKTSQAHIRKLLKRKIAKYLYELGYYYHEHFQADKAREYLLQSILHNPWNLNCYKTLGAEILFSFQPKKKIHTGTCA
jgi:glycosyltransferase involved in cell wall biosynthesis